MGVVLNLCLLILLPLPLECWNCSLALPHRVYGSWKSNLGLCACRSSTLPTVLNLQPVQPFLTSSRSLYSYLMLSVSSKSNMGGTPHSFLCWSVCVIYRTFKLFRRRITRLKYNIPILHVIYTNTYISMLVYMSIAVIFPHNLLQPLVTHTHTQNNHAERWEKEGK